MKKFILSCIVAIFCVCIAASIAVYVGNSPIESHWPNNQIRISIPRRFFVPHGIAKVYHGNGKIAYQYQIINNTKSGDVRFYLPNKTVTMHYLNDKLLGIVDIENDFSRKNKDVIKPKIVFEPENKLRISYHNNGKKLLITGTRTCVDDEFISKLEAYSEQTNTKTLEPLMSCFSFENYYFKDQTKECVARGTYVYPNFKSDFRTVCSLLNTSDGLSKDIKNLKIESLYKEKDDTLQIKAFDKQKSHDNIFVSYKGIKNVVRHIVDTVLIGGSKQNHNRLLSAILNYFTISDSHLIVNNKKVWNTKGDINLTNGFSDPYYIAAYTNNQLSSQLKISSNTLSLKTLYPISKTPMFLLTLKINDLFKDRYKNFIQEISKVINQKIDSQDNDYTELLSDLPEYILEFSDVFQSLNFNLMDIQRQPVLQARLQLKRRFDKENIMASPLSAFEIGLTTYQNGELNHQISGNIEKGFVIDNKEADFQDVLLLLNNANLNTVLEDIYNELELTYAPIMERVQTPTDYIGVDPFFLAFYNTYRDSVLKYKLDQTINQIIALSLDLHSLYEEDENYENLTATDLMRSDVITHEMLDFHNNLLNAFNGKIRIIKSITQKDSYEHDAFILVYEGLPAEACFELATFDWAEQNKDFIAIKAVPRGTPDVSKAFEGETFEKRENGKVYHPYEARSACGKGNSSAVALKFK